MSSSSEVKRVQKKNNRHGTPGTLGRSALSTLNNESTTTTNNNNTAIGANAGDVITTGQKNVIIGYLADPRANNASNQILIKS